MIRIVADSTCDLSKDLIDKYEITIVPLCVVMGEESFYDGLEITPDEMYKWADENKATPKTAAITFEKTMEILKPMVDAQDEIIFFGISEDMSTTCQVARLVGDELNYDKLYVIDSMNLSTGIGLQVIRASELISKGYKAEEIVEKIKSERHLVRSSFIVDTLTYLSRGGRCSSVTALLGNALKLHPEIVVEDGKMNVARKYRGKLKKVLLDYVGDHKDELLKAEPARIFITHSGVDDETTSLVKEALLNLNYFDEVLVTRAGGVISSHCGPGTLGILYYIR